VEHAVSKNNRRIKKANHGKRPTSRRTRKRYGYRVRT
jgi:hypothetical protein